MIFMDKQYHSNIGGEFMDKELLIHVLRLSKEKPFLLLQEMEEVATTTRISQFFSELQHYGLTFPQTIDNNLQISPHQRAQIVLLGAKGGLDFERILKELTWQEFEILTTIVGDEFGYIAKTGMTFSTKERKYQIDVILKNAPYVLLIDCKHFGGTGKKTLLKKAAEDQIERTHAVQSNFSSLKKKLNVNIWEKVILIPVVITWLDEEIFFHEKVPIVPFTKLQSFFRDFYEFFEEIYQIIIPYKKK